MTLSPGTRLGPYEVLGAIGAGGMGEVYRARDIRVDRAVALKVLPEEFFESEERRGRFEREAKLLASLNHPGIATLYSFEEIPFLFLFFLSFDAPPSRHGARRGRGPRPAPRLRPSSTRRISFLRPADRRGAGGGAREGDRPPGPQARERQGHARRARQAPRLRPREGLRGRVGPRLVAVRHALADAHGARRRRRA